jgi:hypothetical protein
MCPGLAAATLVLAAVVGSAQEKQQGKKNADPSRREGPAVASPDEGRASGVIVKVELIKKGPSLPKDGANGVTYIRRLAINTAVVWRDWVRDQGGQRPNTSPRELAERGANSVATKGEPQSEDMLVYVDVVPPTRIESRFRASTDETSKGEKTAAKAREAAEDPASEAKGKGKGKADTSKDRAKEPQATRLQAEDLKPGLFVEVDFGHGDARNIARIVAVLRPVGGPDDVPAAAEGKARK